MTIEERYELAIRDGDPEAYVWAGKEEFGELYDFMFDDVPALIKALRTLADKAEGAYAREGLSSVIVPGSKRADDWNAMLDAIDAAKRLTGALVQ